MLPIPHAFKDPLEQLKNKHRVEILKHIEVISNSILELGKLEKGYEDELESIFDTVIGINKFYTSIYGNEHGENGVSEIKNNRWHWSTELDDNEDSVFLGAFEVAKGSPLEDIFIYIDPLKLYKDTL